MKEVCNFPLSSFFCLVTIFLLPEKKFYKIKMFWSLKDWQTSPIKVTKPSIFFVERFFNRCFSLINTGLFSFFLPTFCLSLQNCWHIAHSVLLISTLCTDTSFFPFICFFFLLPFTSKKSILLIHFLIT